MFYKNLLARLRFFPSHKRNSNLKKSLSAFTLTDIMIAVVASTILLLVVSQYVSDTLQYTQYVSRHQQIRQETFAILNNSIANLIREAVSIDYDNTTADTLALFMDKLEKERVLVRLENQSPQDISQLFFDGDPKVYLHSPNTYIESFTVKTSENPRSADNLEETQNNRIRQPMVHVKIVARAQRIDLDANDVPIRNDDEYFFWEEPRISYEAAFTLRNYNFSNLRK